MPAAPARGASLGLPAVEDSSAQLGQPAPGEAAVSSVRLAAAAVDSSAALLLREVTGRCVACDGVRRRSLLEFTKALRCADKTLCARVYVWVYLSICPSMEHQPKHVMLSQSTVRCFAGTTMGALPNAQEAQLVCMELARRMEDILHEQACIFRVLQVRACVLFLLCTSYGPGLTYSSAAATNGPWCAPLRSFKTPVTWKPPG